MNVDKINFEADALSTIVVQLLSKLDKSMKKGIAILFLIVAVSFSSTAESTETFVAGGVNAFPGEFPYLVSLQLTLFGQSAHFCGGTILSPVWILTVSLFISRRAFIN